MQGVAAVVNVDTIPAAVYNFGDRVVVSGSVKEDIAVRGYLGIGFVCGTKKIQTTSLYMNLKPGEAQAFSQFMTIPQGIEGRCTLQLTVTDGEGNVLEVKNAGEVVITSALEGNFGEVPTSFQLGDVLIIKGRINKQDKSGVEGLATIYFKQNGVPVFIETAPIVNGDVNYRKDLSLIPPGSYILDVLVTDTFGNKKLFENSYTFSIKNTIDFDARFDKTQYSPGETAVLNGLVKSTVHSRLANVEVEFVVDGKAQVVKVADNTQPIRIKYTIPDAAKTGDHTARLSAKDGTGNFGDKELVFTVKAKPTALHLEINGDSLVPEQNVVFTAGLTDQANDPMQETVVAKVWNQKDEFEKSKLVSAQSQDFFIVPAGALPGLWKIELEGFGLSVKKSFTVKEHKALAAELKGTSLIVKNVGNVKYDEYLAVKANEKESGKKVRLGIQEETALALNQLFEPGTYTVYIPLSGKKFENVTIEKEPSFVDNIATSIKDMTGNVVANAGMPEKQTSLIVLLVVILVSLFVVLKPKGDGKQRVQIEQKRHGLSDFILGRRRGHQLRKEKNAGSTEEAPVRGRAYKPEFGRADEQDVADFKDRMNKVWDDHQREEKREKYGFVPPDKKETEGSVFDMFK